MRVGDLRVLNSGFSFFWHFKDSEWFTDDTARHLCAESSHVTYEIQIYLLFSSPSSKLIDKGSSSSYPLQISEENKQKIIFITMIWWRRRLVFVFTAQISHFLYCFNYTLSPLPHKTTLSSWLLCFYSIQWIPKQPQHVDGDDGNQRMNIKQLKWEERGTCWLYSHHSTQREHRKEQHQSREKTVVSFTVKNRCAWWRRRRKEMKTHENQDDRLHLSDDLSSPRSSKFDTFSFDRHTYTTCTQHIQKPHIHTADTAAAVKKMKTRSINSTTHQLCL